MQVLGQEILGVGSFENSAAFLLKKDPKTEFERQEDDEVGT